MTAPSAASSALAAIDACGIVAIIRGPFLADIEGIVTALVDGGIRAIEISLTSELAFEQIERAAAAAGSRAAIGAGTVLRPDEVDEVFHRGGTFVVSPAVDGAVIGAALGHAMLPIPGAYTPTEVLTAVRLGAPAVKLFPADTIAPAFVRAILAPLPGLKLVPTGGVSLERAREFGAAGAWAVGVGSPLVSAPIDLPALSMRASRFVAAMRPLPV
jgi:2-dehydro-3-deoxyphosphogluconate aldolase/(4S)-4-hydroxy-2-oxoglutarate aldolase